MCHHTPNRVGDFAGGSSGSVFRGFTRSRRCLVFDALSTARCYKPPLTLDKCFHLITAERGLHFDPQVVDAYISSRAEFDAIFHEMVDRDRIA